MKYKRGKNYREWTYSSRRMTKIKQTTKPRKRTASSSGILDLILTIVKFGIEVATTLIGSGKRLA